MNINACRMRVRKPQRKLRTLKRGEKIVLFIELSIATMMNERLWRIAGLTMAVETVVLAENTLPLTLFY